MRGNANGALDRSYLHSAITEALWYAVAETETLFTANLAHAVMVSAMYAHPSANLDKGNDQMHELYIRALDTMPYIKANKGRRKGEDAALVEEWKRLNASERLKKAEEEA